ncbi:hypothetical protein ACFE04_024638 [Oxalis oulophora]
MVKQISSDLASMVIHGDILDIILSHVPLLYLLPSSHVSKSWNKAVSSCLHFNSPKPWLLVHTQGIRPPHATSTFAYDPRSNIWIEIKTNQSQPSISQTASIHSAHSTLLYMVSPTKFAFSIDPLHLTWQEVDAPRVWRSDPIVALVGSHVIIAGGACDFEDDPLAVEMYDIEKRQWDTCQSMPETLLDFAVSDWLSTAVYDDKLYLLEKLSGVAHCFDPNSKSWSGPYDFHPGNNVYHLLIGCCNDRLILVGLTGRPSDLQKIKVWEGVIDGESEKLVLKEIGELPKEMVKKFKGEGYSVTSVTVNFKGNFLYIHNPSKTEEIIVCEMVVNGNGAFNGQCKWTSVENLVVNDRSRLMDKFVFTCSNVGLSELRTTFMSGNCEFKVKYS